jgi:hypothetical protein
MRDQLSFDHVTVINMEKNISAIRRELEEVKEALTSLPEIIKDMTDHLNDVLSALEEE